MQVQDIFSIPIGVAEELPEMYRDWRVGRILGRREINVLRDPMCVEIVRDYRGAAYGFAAIKTRVAPLSIVEVDGCSIYSISDVDTTCLLVIIKKPEFFKLPICGE